MPVFRSQTPDNRTWSTRVPGGVRRRTVTVAIATVAYLLGASPVMVLGGQQKLPAQTAPGKPAKPAPAPPVTSPAGSAANPPTATDQNEMQPGDWAPELLDAILTSSNSRAADYLYDAAFGAGPAVIPQLQAALRDDRTAEFAAQCLAYLGGERAFRALATLVTDPRNLDLRRFFLGSLGEYHTPEVTRLLLNAVEKSDQEPDRTVTEAAIWALTVRSDSSLVPELRQAESKIQDFVIHDDVDDALHVIDARASYLASAEGKRAGGSIAEAVRGYFVAALETPAASDAKRAADAGPTPPPPSAKAEVERVTFTPDRTRALAHVTFEDPEAMAEYNIVLQKQLGDWVVVSVWVMSQTEKPQPPLASPKASR